MKKILKKIASENKAKKSVSKVKDGKNVPKSKNSSPPYKIWARRFLKILLFMALAIFALFVYFNIPVYNENKGAKLGITFSKKYAQEIGLDWQEAYIKILDELGVKKVRIPVYWSFVEEKEGEYNFADIDWQLDESKKRGVEVILVLGQKVPRWPECSIPKWASENDTKRKTALLAYIDVLVERYKNNPEIKYWQIENEPFLAFGVCPKLDTDLLDSEIKIVREKDPTRKIMLTDSGELSLWVRAAKRADVFGTTMYRTIYKEGLGYFDYPIGPRFFRFKYWLIKTFAGQENAIICELQAEPWIAGFTTEQPLEEQFKSMNPEKLKDNVSFARKVGFPEIYLWGAEWWYWLKLKQGNSELWETAKTLFANQKIN
jgi:hypothetical protein